MKILSMKLWKMNWLLGLAVITFSCGPAQQKATEEVAEEPKGIVEQEIDYDADSITMKGYLVYDDRIEGKRPAVLVVHEWWGHNDYARERARMLAELGYVAMSIDMYGDGKVANHPDDAGAFAGEVFSNIEGAKARFTAAMDVVKGSEVADPEKIAAIGYCFGGGVVLHMARFGFYCFGVVSFHGSLGTQAPAQPGTVKSKVLVCHGAADPFVSEEAVNGFKKEMEDAGVDYKFVSYEGALHSFTSKEADDNAKLFDMPEPPVGYNEAADKGSWSEMQTFFNEIFAQ